jgi:hypothetical protein
LENGYGAVPDGNESVPETCTCEDILVLSKILDDVDRVTVIINVCETAVMNSDPVPVIPVALEVELRGYGGVEELDGEPDESPDE